MFDLSGRVALVTGASSGLGERFARVLHAAGATVLVTGRRADRLRELGGELGADWIAADLATDTGRVGVVNRVAEQHTTLDILVNNAGTCDGGPLEEQTIDDIRSAVELDLIAVIDMCRLTAPLLFASEHASVINVSSIFGLIASRSAMAGYNASKGGVTNFTRHLAAQWGQRGVRVNALAPGFFPTDLTGGLTDDGLVNTIRDRTLLGRVPTPTELDGSLLYLASDTSSYTTGHTLTVDGGWTAA